jgi:hypothetical protein
LKRTIGIALIGLFALSAILVFVPASFSLAKSSCPSYTTSGNGDTFTVEVTGADGSCPPVYSSSSIIHYVLSTSSAQNPYMITLSDCHGTNCPPTEIIVQGWAGNLVVCGGTEPACSSSGPWTFQVDATVQADKACDTAPVKVTGTGGQPVLILEAGVGDVCSSPPVGVPQFPLGMAALALATLPLLLLIRRFRISPIST